MAIEETWEATRDKVDYLLRFPGLVKDWKEVEGKTIERVFPFGSPQAPKAVLLFADHTFAIISRLETATRDVQAALGVARPALEATAHEALAELDRLVAREQVLQRQARLAKILGAIRQNAPEIPELKAEIRKILDQL